MEVEGEAIEVADVERAEVMVEGVVEQTVVDGEVEGLLPLREAPLRGAACGGRRVSVWEEGIGVGRLGVGREVQSVLPLGQRLCLGRRLALARWKWSGGSLLRLFAGKDIPGMYSTICPRFVCFAMGTMAL